MTLSYFQKKLSISTKLPGHKAFEILGLARKEPSSDELTNARKAAVSIIFTVVNNRVKILFIKRSNYKGVHSSQMAFPGGKFEVEDTSMLNCAIRETMEEIGFDLQNNLSNIALSPIYIPPSKFIVQPFAFFIPDLDEKQLVLESEEVQSIHWLDASALLDKTPFVSKTLEIAEGKIKTKGIDLEGEFVWGASAAMLAEIHHILHTNE